MTDKGEDGSLVEHPVRKLTQKEKEHLESDSVVVSNFKKKKLEEEAKKNWDLFYKRNTTHFFKDRHWITREFPELLEALTELEHNGGSILTKKILLEAGCGVGNTVFPLIQENSELFIHACDFSPRAIDLLKANPDYNEEHCHAFVCDLTSDPLPTYVPGGVDLVTLFFVLSAITPEKMLAVLKNVFNILRDGGLLLFRDYGLYDHAQLRFGRGHKIEENFYFRQDGTRAYYFSEERLAGLAMEAGYEVVLNRYVQKETVNHKEEIHASRIFIQAKLRKPSV